MNAAMGKNQAASSVLFNLQVFARERLEMRVGGGLRPACG
jgi:hypothetical protein